MAMKSREGKYPAPQALAELLYHWMRTWPHARIDKSVTDRLYPYIVEKWREGWSLTEIAQTACSCDDGGTITPSAVATQPVPRGLVKPPEGAKPGDTFSVGELQDVRAVATLRSAANVAELRAQRSTTQMKILDEQIRVARGASRDRLAAQRDKAASEVEQQLGQALALRGRLAELERTGHASRPTKPEAVKRPAHEPAPSKSKPRSAKPAPKAASAKAAAKAATPPAAPIPAPLPAASAPSAASDEATERAIADLYKDE